MQELTQGQGVWRRHPSTGEFTTFPMTVLTPVVKVWYNFLSVKIKPSLHLSTMTKDKTILLYAMTKGLQFDIETVIEQGLIKSTHERCTGPLITARYMGQRMDDLHNLEPRGLVECSG